MIKTNYFIDKQSSIDYRNIGLHSYYNPEKEAMRFINQSIGSNKYSCILLLGCGLGYLVKALSFILPSLKIVCIYYSEKIASVSNNNGYPSWHPLCEINLEDFLYATINEIDLSNMKIIEWPPSQRMFPEAAKSIRNTVNKVIQEFHGSFITTSQFGHIWIKNSFHNFLFTDKLISHIPLHPESPTVITASGPSLEKTLPMLKKIRDKINLIALPSSIPSLISNNICPDIIVVTDPGYYTFLHLKEARLLDTCIVMPISAVTGLYKLSKKIFWIVQPTFFETNLISNSSSNYPKMASYGTVAATALELALFYTGKEVLFCGLDLCFKDIQTHTRPNLKEDLFLVSSNRFKPAYFLNYSHALSQAPIKMENLRFSLPLTTYSNWFSNLSKQKKIRIYYVSPLNEVMENKINIDEMEKLLWKYGVKESVAVSFIKHPEFNKRKRIIINELKKYITIINENRFQIKEVLSNNFIRMDNNLYEILIFTNLIPFSKLFKYKANDNYKYFKQQLTDIMDSSIAFFKRLLNKIVREF